MKSLNFTLLSLLLLATTVFTSPNPGKRLAGNDNGDSETESVGARKRTKYTIDFFAATDASIPSTQPTADKPINLMLTLGNPKQLNLMLTLGTSSKAAASGPTTQPNKDHLMLTLESGASNAAAASVPTTQPKDQTSSRRLSFGSRSNAAAPVPITKANSAVDVEALKRLLDNSNNRVEIVRHAFKMALPVPLPRYTYIVNLQILKYILSEEHDALDDKAVASAIRPHIGNEPVIETIFGLYKGPLKSLCYRNAFKKALEKKAYKSMRFLLKFWRNISTETAGASLATALDAKDLKAVEILLSHKDVVNAVNKSDLLLNHITRTDFPPSDYEDALKMAFKLGNFDAIRIINKCNVPADFDVNLALTGAGED